ncbi:MAG: dienelactone hydrolase family protein [Acidobacteriaceae bacterium]|jgi:carboxymethylenebutenolidase
MVRLTLKILAALTLLASTATLPAQDWAKAALEKSPRHREYVALKHGDRTLQAFVVYPEVSHKAPVVVLIHEIFGLSDWAKEMADELAAQGFIVIAPDLVSGFGPNGGGIDSFASQDAVTKAVSALDPAVVTADLDAAADYAKKIPSANGKLFVTGFCWGGGKSFAFAAHRHGLAAAFVFYGTPPPDVTTITAPVYGFYAGNDARITATVPDTVVAMKAAGKKYDPVTYDGAGHGFMRAGEAPDANPANKAAREQGFQRLVDAINKANAGTAMLHMKPVPAKKPELVSVAAAKSVAEPASCHDATPASTAKSDGKSTAPPATMDMASMM